MVTWASWWSPVALGGHLGALVGYFGTLGGNLVLLQVTSGLLKVIGGHSEVSRVLWEVIWALWEVTRGLWEVSLGLKEIIQGLMEVTLGPRRSHGASRHLRLQGLCFKSQVTGGLRNKTWCLRVANWRPLAVTLQLLQVNCWLVAVTWGLGKVI